MYYFFKPKMVYWHKNVISAHYLNREPGKLEPVWWYGKPLLPTSLEFEFCIPGKAPVLDNYFPGLLIDVYSERLISIFSNRGISFELFPAKFFDKKTGEALEMNHHVFRLLDISDCLDEEKTEYVGTNIKMLVKASFTKEFLKSGRLLTRIRGNEGSVLIHESLKSEIEAAGIFGCQFRMNKIGIE